VPLTRRDYLMQTVSGQSLPQISAAEWAAMKKAEARAMARVSHHIRWGGSIINPDGTEVLL
jgi:hypothetical protein